MPSLIKLFSVILTRHRPVTSCESKDESARFWELVHMRRGENLLSQIEVKCRSVQRHDNQINGQSASLSNLFKEGFAVQVIKIPTVPPQPLL